MKWTVLVWYFLSYFKVSICLRVLGVSVPPFKQRGESATLTCDYELEGGKLYSVKWYRDHEEFYRFMPKLRPPQRAHSLDGVTVDVIIRSGRWQVCSVKEYRDSSRVLHRFMTKLRPPQRDHSLDGVTVDLDKSSARRVHLKDLSLKSRGLYRCEVSKEAPSFHSAQAEAFMEVYYFPRESPRITGYERPYSTMEPLDVNCSSANSFPAPELQWHVDGQKVTDRSWLVPYTARPASQGLLVSTLGLRAPAKPMMQLRCVATLGTHQRERTVVIETNSSSKMTTLSLFTLLPIIINIRIYDKIL